MSWHYRAAALCVLAIIGLVAYAGTAKSADPLTAKKPSCIDISVVLNAIRRNNPDSLINEFKNGRAIRFANRFNKITKPTVWADQAIIIRTPGKREFRVVFAIRGCFSLNVYVPNRAFYFLMRPNV